MESSLKESRPNQSTFGSKMAGQKSGMPQRSGQRYGEAEKGIREELETTGFAWPSAAPPGRNWCVMPASVNELKHANGRTGMGAVMGSKNLRAIAPGDAKTHVCGPGKVREIGKKVLEFLPQSAMAQNLKKFGTPMFVMP